MAPIKFVKISNSIIYQQCKLTKLIVCDCLPYIISLHPNKYHFAVIDTCRSRPIYLYIL